jgi:tetratricopeptide (TPR) repeat protein
MLPPGYGLKYLSCIATCLLVTAIFLLAVPASMCRAVESLPEDNPKFLTIKKIYSDVARSFGDGRTPPRLVVTPAGGISSRVVAWSDPGNAVSFGVSSSLDTLKEGYIAIDERVYDLFASLGSDRDNAVAFLLGHELAHFYLRHGWVGDFGNSFAAYEMGKKMMRVASYEEVIKCEAEADYFGGFYGFLAGYDTLGLAPTVLDMIYASYRLPDKIPNYPTRGERKEIAAKTERNLRKMVPVFETANRLLLLEKYGEAARLFEYLTQLFPSREMFNNAGVAYALEALRLFTKSEAVFSYPFEFDTETRLHGTATRVKGVRTEALLKERRRLLDAAEEKFDKALQQDKGYSVALINMAAVNNLRGEREDAAHYANRGIELARKNGETGVLSNGLVVRGIIRAEAARADEALADFSRASSLNNHIASVNMAILQGNAKQATAKCPLPSGTPEERISGVLPRSTFVKDKGVLSFTLQGADNGGASITIHSMRRDSWDDTLALLDGRMIRLLGTGKGYTGKSALGIAIGNGLQDVRKLYGEPAAVVATRQGMCLVYTRPEIIFSIDREERVTGWVIFARE